MDTVYVKASRITHNTVEVNLETLLIINLFKLCDSDNLKLKVVLEQLEDAVFTIHLKPCEYEVVTEIPAIASYCLWPVVVVGNTVVAGLCSVARQIIKSSQNENVQYLLGFRCACLMACSESSIWTKFCEVDMVKTVKDVVQNFENYNGEFVNLPIDLTRFEYHLEQPVRIHNVYKMAREKSKNKDLKSSIPLKDLDIPHAYSEGPFLTLADVLLFPCISILTTIFSEDLLNNHLPLIYSWFKNMQMQDLFPIKFQTSANLKIQTGIKEVKQVEILHQSLYTSDRTRYNPHNRIYTKQNNIESALNNIETSKIMIKNDLKPYGLDIDFNWSTIPLEANPNGGALPAKRSDRKSQQLENLAKAVLQIAGDKSHTIVDFCSGSGHLGILLATLLPKCKIMLVENKERSLLRAKERIANLNLSNVVLLQCNLDYFQATFNIGVSLHACGVATDLVIQNCLRNKAHFVSCPCCYGGIHDCYHLKYPRSDIFCEYVKYSDYLNVAHAADQTHDEENVKTKQGYFCMDVIDTDRKLYAEKHGYVVYLGKLIPTTCTPKNNLIVGICNG